jgi:hypothetical protein
MKVNEHLLLEFLSTMRDFVDIEVEDQMDGVLPLNENACREKVNYVSTVVQTLEQICGIGPEDYSAKYYCRDCGWVGNEPGFKMRDEVYLTEECEGEDDKVFFCPRCKVFEISHREG